MIEGFYKIIVCAGVQSGDALVDRAARGENEDRRLVLPAPERPNEPEAVAIRQAEIDQQQVIFRTGDGRLSLAEGADGVDASASAMDGLHQ